MTTSRRLTYRIGTGAVVAGLLLGFDGARARVFAQTVSVEVFGGSAYNVPTPLTVRQTGHPDLRFSARYDTKPFGPYAPYYSWRASFWNAEREGAWEISQVHHRLFLTNNPPEIELFAIHYGYNFFLAGRSWRRGRFVYHLDGGVLICNPSNIVRGQMLNTRDTGIFGAGYRLSGVAAQIAVSREFYFSKHVFAGVNGGLLMGRARVPVVDGSADVPNVGLHGQVGVGVVLPFR